MNRKAFLQGEGTAWFRRNAQALSEPRASDDPVVGMLATRGRPQRRVLEIGCANGWRLAALHGLGRGLMAAVGVEPSREALEDGRARWPYLDLRHGHAAALPLAPGEQFDLIILAFVLHWVEPRDRQALYRTLARALAPGGLVAVADFRPRRAHRVPYHHLPGLWTYKAHYTDLLARALGLRVSARKSFEHGGGADADENRCEVALLVRAGRTAT